MRKVLKAIVFFLFIISLVACGGNKLPDWANTEALTENAKTLIECMNNYDYEGVAELFDNPEVDSSTFAANDETLKNVGAFACYGDIAFSSEKTNEGREFVRVIQVVNYENGKLTFTASFYEDGSVAGFRMY